MLVIWANFEGRQYFNLLKLSYCRDDNFAQDLTEAYSDVPSQLLPILTLVRRKSAGFISGTYQWWLVWQQCQWSRQCIQHKKLAPPNGGRSLSLWVDKADNLPAQVSPIISLLCRHCAARIAYNIVLVSCESDLWAITGSLGHLPESSASWDSSVDISYHVQSRCCTDHEEA